MISFMRRFYSIAYKHKYALLFYALLFCLLLAFSSVFAVGFDDSYNIQVSKNLAQTGEYMTDFAKFDREITTGFPVLVPIALFFKVFSIGVIQERAVMVLFFLGLVAILIKLPVELGVLDSRKAKLTLVLSVFIWLFTVQNFFQQAYNAIGEFPALFFFALSCLYFQKYFKTHKLKNVILSGIFLGLTLSTKYIMVTAVAALFFSMFLYVVGSKKDFKGLILLITVTLIPEFIFQIYRLFSSGIDQFTKDSISTYSHYAGLNSNFNQAVYPNRLLAHINTLTSNGFQSILPVSILILLLCLIYFSFKFRSYIMLGLSLFAVFMYSWWFFITQNTWLRHLVTAEMVVGFLFSLTIIKLTFVFFTSKTKSLAQGIIIVFLCVIMSMTFSREVLLNNFDIGYHLKVASSQKSLANFIILHPDSDYYFPIHNQATEISFLANKKLLQKTPDFNPFLSGKDYIIFTDMILRLSPGSYSFSMRALCKKIVFQSYGYKLCSI